MINASFKNYPDYRDFTTDFLFTVISDGSASIIINYEDTIGVIQTLNEKVLNGNSLCLERESFDNIDNDILLAKDRSGLMMITVFDQGDIIAEPLVFTNAEAFPETTYFVEYDAQNALKLPLNGCVIPFQIEKKFKFQ